jgi:glyoxylase-like metal-dependent hydrolase (beta-lactamase superfamily II)
LASIPFVKDLDFTYGAPDRLTPRIRRVIANNPGPYTFTGSGTYIIGGGDVAVIDPGPDNDAHLKALADATVKERVSHILITHTHRDHCGGARKFAEMTGAKIYSYGAHPVEKSIDAPALDEGGDYDFAPDHRLTDGDVIEGNGWTIDALHTPGHLSNHLCFALREDAALFTGDHVMGWATTVIAPPSGHMGDYLASLDLLLKRDDAVYYPTHGAPIEIPHRFVRAVRTHRRIRDGQIMTELKAGRETIREITARIYADIDKRLHGAAALNVYAHLLRLVEVGDVVVDGAPTMKSRFRLAR